MLQLSATLLNKSVLSLRAGTVIAQITEPIINTDKLKIEGFFCHDRFNKQELILLSQDIRDMTSNGYIVNDHDVLSEPDDLVRLQEVIETRYSLIGKRVVTVSGEKVGKVSDYSTEMETMYIQKIYVSRSILKSLSGSSLGIERSQIQEVTDKKIIINDLLKTVPVGVTANVA